MESHSKLKSFLLRTGKDLKILKLYLNFEIVFKEMKG